METEGHVCFQCSCYNDARCNLFRDIERDTAARIMSEEDTDQKLLFLLSSHSSRDWCATAKFLAWMRQLRRKQRLRFAKMQHDADKQCFDTQKCAWQAKGRHVCRHGMFYMSRPEGGCQCIRGEFGNALLMPMINTDLKQL
eukprot:380289-Karenia_brevis.AAC.1